MRQDQRKQVAGLSKSDADKILAGLAWLEAAPDFLADTEGASDAFFQWVEDACPADTDFSPTSTSLTDGCFLWSDEDGNEWEHDCR